MSFSLNSWPFARIEAGSFRASCSCWTHLSCERSSPFEEVDHGQHGLNLTAGNAGPFLDKGTMGILGQAAIAHLGEAPQPLEGQKRMIHLGTHAGFAPVGFPVGVCQGTVPIGAIAIEAGFVSMQQVPVLRGCRECWRQ